MNELMLGEFLASAFLQRQGFQSMKIEKMPENT